MSRIGNRSGAGRPNVLVIVTDTKDGYDHNLDSALTDLVKIALGA